MTQSDDWSQYWREDGAGGEVFVNSEGQRHPALTAFWNGIFADLIPGSDVIDIACGAGSIFVGMDNAARFRLHGTDLSGDALRLLVSRLPEVKTEICGADRLPYPDASFDLAVSQFGIEYAGRRAFTEAARILKAGGGLALLAHVRDGYIDSRNAIELDVPRLVIACDFISCAIEATRAVFAEDRALFESASAGYVPAEKRLAAYLDQHPHGVHAHLYSGFRRLFEQRQQYDLIDIVGWLEGMRGEVERTVARLEEMRRAALSKEDIAAIGRDLEQLGVRDFRATPFFTPGNEQPVAWHLSGSKHASY